MLSSIMVLIGGVRDTQDHDNGDHIGHMDAPV